MIEYWIAHSIYQEHHTKVGINKSRSSRRIWRVFPGCLGWTLMQTVLQTHVKIWQRFVHTHAHLSGRLFFSISIFSHMSMFINGLPLDFLHPRLLYHDRSRKTSACLGVNGVGVRGAEGLGDGEWRDVRTVIRLQVTMMTSFSSVVRTRAPSKANPWALLFVCFPVIGTPHTFLGSWARKNKRYPAKASRRPLAQHPPSAKTSMPPRPCWNIPSMCLLVCVCASMCMCKYVHVCACMCMYVNVCVCVYMCSNNNKKQTTVCHVVYVWSCM